jgi:hypothetical protein
VGRRVNRTEASLLSTIAEWGPLSRAPAPLNPMAAAEQQCSTSQLSQFHKAESSFVFPHKRKAVTPTLFKQDNGGHARTSKEGRDVPCLSK